MSKKRKNPLRIVNLQGGSKPLVCGLFKMSDTLGFPLADGILQSERIGGVACLSAYVCDAVAAGWSAEKAIEKVKEAMVELGRACNSLLEAGLRTAVNHCERFTTDAMVECYGEME